MPLTSNDIHDAGFLIVEAYDKQAKNNVNSKNPVDGDWQYLNPAALGIINSHIDANGFLLVDNLIHAIDLQVLLAYNPSSHTLAIAFRGSSEWLDFATDASGGLSDFRNIYQAIASDITTVINNAAGFGATRVLITGHSLGGAMAEAAMAAHYQDTMPIVGVTFGSPGIGGPNNPATVSDLLNIGHVDLQTTSYNDTEGDPVYRIRSTGKLGNEIHVDLPDQPDYNIWELTRNALLFGDLGQHSQLLYEQTAGLIATELQQNAADRHPFDVRAFSYVIGTNYSIPVLAGSDGPNVIIGDEGKDIILGGAGNDILDGGYGDDFLKGGVGNDIIYGGQGNDTAAFDQSYDQYTFTFSGPQVIVASRAAGTEGTDTISGVENFQFAGNVYSREQLIGMLAPAGNLVGGTGDASVTPGADYSRGGTGTASNGPDTIAGDVSSTLVVGTSGQALTSAIENAGDKDYVKVYLVQGAIYRIAMVGAANHGYAALQDSFFRVRDGQNNALASPTDQAGGDQLDYTAGYTGWHYISVGAGGVNFATLTGGYSLTVTLTNAPILNHNPLATTDDLGVTYGQIVTGNVLDNDSDVDHNTLSVDFLSSFHTALGGTLDLLPNGAFQYIAPSSGASSAQDSFSYTLRDGAGGSAAGVVHLNLSPAPAGGLFTTGDDYVTVPTGGGTYHALAGNDVVFGSNFADIIYGDDGNDFLHGLDGNDYLVGGNGDNGLIGGPGDDWLVPGAGRNQIWGDGVSTDYGGFDTVDYSNATGGISVNMQQGTVTGGGANDILTGIDSIIGSGFGDTILTYSVIQRAYGGGGNDTLVGYTGEDELHGGTGDDNLQGYTGKDRLYGDDGNDLLTGGDGDDILDGGTRDDQVFGENGNDYIFASAGNDRLAGNDGIDTVDFSNAPTGFTRLGSVPNWGTSSLEMIEIVVATPFADNFSASGFQELHLGAGDDVVTASGIGKVFGDQGDDHIFALDVGQVFGGAGDDVLVALATTVELNGDEGNDQLSGSDGIDHRYFGGAGNDTLTGASGNEFLSGDAGNDQISGGGGNDTISGGAGADTLTGGSGFDKFVFDGLATGDALVALPLIDRVTDYTISEGDQIDLSGLVGTAYSQGNGETVASLVRVAEDASNGFALLQIDSDGAANGSAFLTIARLDGLHPSDTLSVVMSSLQPGGTTISVGLPPNVADNFGGDGVSDILFRNDNGITAIYDMHADGSSNAIQLGTIDPAWKIEDTGNYGDGSDGDILWRNSSSGQIVYWSITGGEKSRGYTDLGTFGPQWQIQTHNGSSDFTGDGADDVLLRNSSNNELVFWNMQGGRAVSTVDLGTAPNSQWDISGTGDFNGDSKADILWHNNVAGDAFIWASGGTGPTTQLGTINPSWTVASIGDFKGDGVDDILWFNTSTHQAVYWDNHANGTSTLVDLGITPNGFTFDKPRDLTGDGTADFLLHNSSNGMIVSAANDGGTIGAFHVIDTLPTSWHVI
ncbi:VCBS repeat-containing protein [Bradyrhizobium sp. 146]|uniref:Ig-like domain-containing protein n=1 Tax=Bradyrhizobium sp. 146 TaxID=2782622 RepID=UPI001FF952ED|nr:FG-GAP-like repeat-containing protein [Bradyrhizobium sp. 146]MCK1706009.1 VCBS repeat-containing protein [Bradyrhizobium sp. 146]